MCTRRADQAHRGVSLINRELTKGSSPRGTSTIDDVGSESVAKPATTTTTLHGDGRGISCFDDTQPRARSESQCEISGRSSTPAPKDTSGRAAAHIDEASGACCARAFMLSNDTHRRDAQDLTEEGQTQWVRDLAVKPGQQTLTVPTDEDRMLPDALESDSAPFEPQYLCATAVDRPRHSGNPDLSPKSGL